MIAGDLSEFESPEIEQESQALFARVVFAKRLWSVRVEHPTELYSYARVLAALREKGFING